LALEAHEAVEVIPAAKRLVGSLRDMGYEFQTAVADLVDNSIAADASHVSIDIEFEGEDSWVRIADDGAGMSPAELREAMRYGSSRIYAANDLGKFGLGLKVASLSQCRRLTVASRRSRERFDFTAYCWDLEHIERTNRWELITLPRDTATGHLITPLKDSAGTVVLWQRLDRILGYEHPDGESARRRLGLMCREVEGHLAVVFHRFLAGEVPGRRRLRMTLNGREIRPWDPFARHEKATRALEPVSIPVAHAGMEGKLTLEPFVLPHQADFSSPDSFRCASGPANWNQQQGFYVYRAHRLIQSGGWCRIRTLDEHTKLARVAMSFSPQLDNAFRVNVAKMRIELPAGIREPITDAISPVTRLANDRYRRSAGEIPGNRGRPQTFALRQTRPDITQTVVEALLSVATAGERKTIQRVAARLKKRRS
jgi:anti-sigma regulatory factor (Ser/Thr protein kinase)